MTDTTHTQRNSSDVTNPTQRERHLPETIHSSRSSLLLSRLELSDTQVYEPSIRALFGSADDRPASPQSGIKSPCSVPVNSPTLISSPFEHCVPVEGALYYRVLMGRCTSHSYLSESVYKGVFLCARYPCTLGGGVQQARETDTPLLNLTATPERNRHSNSKS